MAVQLRRCPVPAGRAIHSGCWRLQQREGIAPIVGAGPPPPGIDPSRLGSRGIGIHSLRTTAINDAIRNGATMHEVRELAGHADI